MAVTTVMYFLPKVATVLYVFTLTGASVKGATVFSLTGANVLYLP